MGRAVGLDLTVGNVAGWKVHCLFQKYVGSRAYLNVLTPDSYCFRHDRALRLYRWTVSIILRLTCVWPYQMITFDGSLFRVLKVFGCINITFNKFVILISQLNDHNMR